MEYQIIKPKNKDSDQSSMQVEEPRWTLEEVALPSSTLNDVDEMLAYIANKRKLLHDWEFERFLKTGNGLSINFFGLPGTGKSITAEAVAQRLGTTIVRANYGELESELMGGTAKNLLSVFDIAAKSNSVLFFDEADSLLSRRVSNLSQAADYGINATKSTMLTLMDKFDGVLIFATNLFENYDEAFLRRIIFNVEFLPPDTEMRRKLWEFHLSKKIPRDVSYDRIAEITDGLCGGDIRNITIKLGLKLISGKASTINEELILEEIKRYQEIKKRHQMDLEIPVTVLPEAEQEAI